MSVPLRKREPDQVAMQPRLCQPRSGSDSPLSPRAILEMAREVFPPSECMLADFRGAHSLTLTLDGLLCLTIWNEGKARSVFFETRCDEANGAELWAFLHVLKENWEAETV